MCAQVLFKPLLAVPLPDETVRVLRTHNGVTKNKRHTPMYIEVNAGSEGNWYGQVCCVALLSTFAFVCVSLHNLRSLQVCTTCSC